MISSQWRQRLIYTAMSVFVAWHTLALVVAPAPNNSEIVQSFRILLQPYLTLFRLDNKWDFYAPEVDKGRQFRYDIVDASAKSHSFVPTDELNWFHPAYWWFRSWYDAVIDYPEIYADHFAALLCRKHASLQPASISLLYFQVEDFSPENHLSGNHPLDSEFVKVITLKQAACPDR
jgi:hypothetical protein